MYAIQFTDRAVPEYLGEQNGAMLTTDDPSEALIFSTEDDCLAATRIFRKCLGVARASMAADVTNLVGQQPSKALVDALEDDEADAEIETE